MPLENTVLVTKEDILATYEEPWRYQCIRTVEFLEGLGILPLSIASEKFRHLNTAAAWVYYSGVLIYADTLWSGSRESLELLDQDAVQNLGVETVIVERDTWHYMRISPKGGAAFSRLLSCLGIPREEGNKTEQTNPLLPYVETIKQMYLQSPDDTPDKEYLLSLLIDFTAVIFGTKVVYSRDNKWKFSLFSRTDEDDARSQLEAHIELFNVVMPDLNLDPALIKIDHYIFYTHNGKQQIIHEPTEADISSIPHGASYEHRYVPYFNLVSGQTKRIKDNYPEVLKYVPLSKFIY